MNAERQALNTMKQINIADGETAFPSRRASDSIFGFLRAKNSSPIDPANFEPSRKRLAAWEPDGTGAKELRVPFGDRGCRFQVRFHCGTRRSAHRYRQRRSFRCTALQPHRRYENDRCDLRNYWARQPTRLFDNHRTTRRDLRDRGTACWEC